MCSVDDILAVGLRAPSGWFYGELYQLLLIKHLGELRSAGKDIPFLGRVLQGDESGGHLQAPKPDVHEMVDLLGLRACKAVGTTGTTTRAVAPTVAGKQGSFYSLCLSARV